MKIKSMVIWFLLLQAPIMALPYFGKHKETDDVKKNKKVQFFQKQHLNDPIMSIDRDPLRAQLDQHIYLVREGSVGGFDSVGGSCGCN